VHFLDVRVNVSEFEKVDGVCQSAGMAVAGGVHGLVERDVSVAVLLLVVNSDVCEKYAKCMR